MGRERWRRLLAVTPRRARSDIDDEFRFHVEMLIQELLASGSSMQAARAEAERRFGAVAPVRDECLTIDQRRRRRAAFGEIMNTLGQDLRYVVRTLAASRGFSFVVILTLAIGIGATTAMYSIVDTVLLRALPYPASTELVGLFDVQGTNGGLPASYQEFRRWAERSGDALSEVGAWFGTGEVLSGSGDAEQLSGARISAAVPKMLGIRPIVGRTFRLDEEPAEATPVVMLSEGLWRSHFAADPSVVGKRITLTGKPYLVVGVFAGDARAVLPSKWSFASGRANDFLLPLRLNDAESPPGQHWLAVVGRMRSGLTVGQARRRLSTMAATIRADGTTTHGVEVTPLDQVLLGNVKAPLTILLFAVGLLLVIACANVANLLLARGAARRRELAVRAALGAGRRRIATLVLVESVVLSLLGGAAGIVLAFGAIRVARTTLADTIPRILEVSIDLRILGVAIVVTVLVGVLAGLIPAVRTSRIDPVRDLREGGRSMTGGASHDRVRRSLIIAEIALSFTLLVTGALLVRSVVNLMGVPKGFDPNGLVSGRTWLPASRYPDQASQLAFWNRFAREIGAALGETSTTLTSALPVDGGFYGDVTIEGQSRPDGANPIAEKRVVGANYFAVLRAPLVAGRPFATTDVAGALPVVIVNQAFVNRWMSGANPIGKRINVVPSGSALQTIVGVVGDVREGPLGDAPKPAVYTPAEQSGSSFLNVVLRTNRPLGEITTVFRRVLRSIDPTLPLLDVRRASDVVISSVRQQRLVAALLGTFAVIALLLAAVGLYGVVSYSVAQRTQEFGIRAALGAQSRDLVSLVFRQSVAFTAVGLVLGVLGALASTGFIATQLFGVSANDASTLALAAALVGIAVLAASAVPAIRATRVDPLAAIRES